MKYLTLFLLLTCFVWADSDNSSRTIALMRELADKGKRAEAVLFIRQKIATWRYPQYVDAHLALDQRLHRFYTNNGIDHYKNVMLGIKQNALHMEKERLKAKKDFEEHGREEDKKLIATMAEEVRKCNGGIQRQRKHILDIRQAIASAEELLHAEKYAECISLCSKAFSENDQCGVLLAIKAAAHSGYAGLLRGRQMTEQLRLAFETDPRELVGYRERLAKHLWTVGYWIKDKELRKLALREAMRYMPANRKYQNKYNVLTGDSGLISQPMARWVKPKYPFTSKDIPVIQYQNALFLMHMQEYNKARELLKKAIVKRDSFELHLVLAETGLEQGMLQTAEAELARAKALLAKGISIVENPVVSVSRLAPVREARIRLLEARIQKAGYIELIAKSPEEHAQAWKLLCAAIENTEFTISKLPRCEAAKQFAESLYELRRCRPDPLVRAYALYLEAKSLRARDKVAAASACTKSIRLWDSAEAYELGAALSSEPWLTSWRLEQAMHLLKAGCTFYKYSPEQYKNRIIACKLLLGNNILERFGKGDISDGYNKQNITAALGVISDVLKLEPQNAQAADVLKKLKKCIPDWKPPADAPKRDPLEPATLPQISGY